VKACFEIVNTEQPENAATGIRETGEFYAARKNLLKSVLTLADWLRIHPLEEPDGEEDVENSG
jgi:hypothetical protein